MRVRTISIKMDVFFFFRLQVFPCAFMGLVSFAVKLQLSTPLATLGENNGDY